MNTRELATEIIDGITAYEPTPRGLLYRSQDISLVEALLNKERPERKFEDWDRLTMLEDENAKLKAELKALQDKVKMLGFGWVLRDLK